MSDSIWRSPFSPEQLQQRIAGTMAEHLQIEIVEIGDDFIKGTMPLSQRTRQPLGLMHGGANVALAETLGSLGANMVVDREKYFCVGQEINANHVRSVRAGLVTGVATLDHSGRTSQVWSIRLYDDAGKLCCVSRLTVAVLERK